MSDNTPVPQLEAQTPAVQNAHIPEGYGGNVDPKDLILPRIEMTQALSPIVVSGIKKSGELLNHITKEPLQSNVLIPVKLEKNFIKWRPRTEGGGVVYQTTDPTDPRVIRDSEWIDGKRPSCTAYLNFICIVDKEPLPLILSFSGSNYQTGRKLFTMTQMGSPDGVSVPDIYNAKYKIGTLLKTNKYGSFYIYTIDRLGPTTEDERIKAKKVYTLLAGNNFTAPKPDTYSDEQVAGASDNNEF